MKNKPPTQPQTVTLQIKGVPRDYRTKIQTFARNEGRHQARVIMHMVDLYEASLQKQQKRSSAL